MASTIIGASDEFERHNRWIPGIPFDDYLDDGRVHAHYLITAWKRSRLRADFERERRREESEALLDLIDAIEDGGHAADLVAKKQSIGTKATRMGSAVHCAVFGRECGQDYAVIPKLDRRRKADKETFVDFVLENAEKIILTEDEGEVVENLAVALKANPFMSEWMQKPGAIYECTGHYVDPIANVECSIRPDLMVKSEHTIIDLKTTENASEQIFMREGIRKYGYLVSAGMYAFAYEVIENHPLERWVWVVGEKSPPHDDVRIYELSDEDLRYAQASYREALTRAMEPWRPQVTPTILELRDYDFMP